MTIIARKGNLLDAKGIIVHGCNMQGVMGSGVARSVRDRYFGAYNEYLKNYYKGLGSISYFKVLDEGKVIVNAITQEFYGKDGRKYVSEEAVLQSFGKVALLANILDIRVVNFPLIGCGLGGGDWNVIGPIIDEALGPYIEKVLWTL